MALIYGMRSDPILSLGTYTTRVTDGPTGVYFDCFVPVLDDDDTDIARDLVTAVRDSRQRPPGGGGWRGGWTRGDDGDKDTTEVFCSLLDALRGEGQL